MDAIYGRVGTQFFYMEPNPDVYPPPAGWVVMQSLPPAASGMGNQYFEYRAQANGTWLEFKMPAPAKAIVWYDGRLQVDNGDGTFSPVSPLALPARRRIKLDVTLGTGGSTAVDLTQYGFTLAPTLYQIITKNAAKQVLFPKFSGVTKDAATVTGERSRATLLLSDGPFEPAVAGDVVSFWVQEN